jgi:hypothetical protein
VLGIKELPDYLQPLFSAALQPLYSKRPSIRELLPLVKQSKPILIKTLFDEFVDQGIAERQHSLESWKGFAKETSGWDRFTLEELEHLWQLANGRQKQKPPTNDASTSGSSRPHVLAVPQLTLLEQPNDDSIEKRTMALSLSQTSQSSSTSTSGVLRVAFLPNEPHLMDWSRLEERILELSLKAIRPLVHDDIPTLPSQRPDSFDLPDTFNSESEADKSSLSSFDNSKLFSSSFVRNSLSLTSDSGDYSDRTSNQFGSERLPTQIKENDVLYQCERLLLFRRLLDEWPITRNRLTYEASIDIPPFYRSRTWAALLDVRSADRLMYERMDRISVGPADRQLAVDIPRCHQYDELLASPAGHAKLKRVLKAWLMANEADCVYWQGLDSLCAPFVWLHFANESTAFACLNAFTRKYLQGFFAPDNAPTVRRYLAQFSQLLAFHDPRLAQHLHSFAFSAELYAIPWFLTMFTHVLPLYKLLHVWDALLLSGPSFPLAFGLAILQQLRSRLLTCSFNECILLFSDLPDIHVEECVGIARRLFSVTPASLLERQVSVSLFQAKFQRAKWV